MTPSFESLFSRIRRRVFRLQDGLVARRILSRANRAGRVVLFESDWKGIFYYLRPLVRRMISEPGVFALIATRRSEISDIEKALSDGLDTNTTNVSVISFDGLERINVEVDCLISCQPFSRVAADFSGIPKIQTLHGMADKRGELFGPSNLQDFTHLFSPAPVITDLARDRLLSKDISEHGQIEIVEVGCPKTDDLFDGTFDRDDVLRSIGLANDRPTVLYAPTWEKEASLEQHGEEIVSSLSKLGINLLVKPHPLTLADRRDRFLIENGHGGKDWGRILKAWERRHTNTRWVRDPYANPYLVTADLLVSEGSGVAFEFVLLDKPIVFIDTPMVYERHGVDNLHHRLRGCGVVLPTVNEVGSAVRQHLQVPAAAAATRKAFIQMLTYNPGIATDVAMRALERILGSNL